jgi:protein tyrosine phosphatase (PTP) superfamily phosphohydrolase (DUF442 family)
MASIVRAALVCGAAVTSVLVAAFPGIAIGETSRAEERQISGLPAKPVSDWKAGPLSGPIGEVPVRNFGVVTPGCLYRSAQPGDDVDYDWLVKQGFKGIVCLRAEHDCSDTADKLKEKGVAYLHLSLPNEHAPTDEQAQQFLAFVKDSSHWPALVHCKDGIGRASTMVALARYSIDGWSMDKAMHEARKYRPFNFPMFGRQKRWLERWSANHERAAERIQVVAVKQTAAEPSITKQASADPMTK